MKKILFLPIAITTLLLAAGCKDAKTVKQKEKEKDALEDFQKAADETTARQIEQLENEGGLDNDPAVLDKMIEASKKLENASTGDEAKGAKVMRLFMTSVQGDMAKLTAAQESLIQSTDYSKVKTAEDIDALSAKTKIYLDANTKLTNKIKAGWISELRENLEKEGLDDKFTEGFLRGFNTSMKKQKPSLLIIRKTDEQICQAVLKQHEILKKNLEAWQWSAAEGVPNFSDDTVLNLFNEQATKIQEASAQQLEAQKKLLNVKQ